MGFSQLMYDGAMVAQKPPKILKISLASTRKYHMPQKQLPARENKNTAALQRFLPYKTAFTEYELVYRSQRSVLLT